MLFLVTRDIYIYFFSFISYSCLCLPVWVCIHIKKLYASLFQCVYTYTEWGYSYSHFRPNPLRQSLSLNSGGQQFCPWSLWRGLQSFVGSLASFKAAETPILVLMVHSRQCKLPHTSSALCLYFLGVRSSMFLNGLTSKHDEFYFYTLEIFLWYTICVAMRKDYNSISLVTHFGSTIICI